VGSQGAAPAAPRPRKARKILVASTGAPVEQAVLEAAVELAGEEPTRMYVMSVARIWGVKYGLPNPGLYPNRLEWEQQRKVVDDAADWLRTRGFEVTVRAVAARNAPRAIGSWATGLGCHIVVIGQPPLARWERIVKGEDARDLARRTKAKVHAVPVPPREPAKPFVVKPARSARPAMRRPPRK
jgi:K+-sensing histidine kinase KdpD